MPINVETLRTQLVRFREFDETKIAGDGGGLDNFIHEDEVDAMLTEIEQLRAENLKLFAALKNLHSYAANGDVFSPCLDDREDHEWSTADSSAQCIHCGLHIDPELD